MSQFSCSGGVTGAAPLLFHFPNHILPPWTRKKPGFLPKVPCALWVTYCSDRIKKRWPMSYRDRKSALPDFHDPCVYSPKRSDAFPAQPTPQPPMNASRYLVAGLSKLSKLKRTMMNIQPSVAKPSSSDNHQSDLSLYGVNSRAQVDPQHPPSR